MGRARPRADRPASRVAPARPGPQKPWGPCVARRGTTGWRQQLGILRAPASVLLARVETMEFLLACAIGVVGYWLGRRGAEERGRAAGYQAARNGAAVVFIGSALQRRLFTVADLVDVLGRGAEITAEAIRYVRAQERANEEFQAVLWSDVGRPPQHAPRPWLARDPDASPRATPGGVREICLELLEGHLDPRVFRAELLRRSRAVTFAGERALALCFSRPVVVGFLGGTPAGDEIRRLCDEYSWGSWGDAEFRLVQLVGKLGVEKDAAAHLERLAQSPGMWGRHLEIW